MRTSIAVVASLLVLALAVPSSAGPITASDNAYVKKGEEDKDDDNRLMVKSNGANGNSRIGYLRFGVGGTTVGPLDTVTLDMHLVGKGSGNLNTLNVYSLTEDDVEAETTWNSVMTWDGRPSGTTNLPNANVTVLNTYDYADLSTGEIGLTLPTDRVRTLLAADTNDEVTVVLFNNSSHNGGQTSFAAIGNSDNYLEPTLTIDPRAPGTYVTVVESAYGGTLQEDDQTPGSPYSYNQSTTHAVVGNHGGDARWDAIQMLLFELPDRPAGGFQAEDTSFEITVERNDDADSNADLWAIGYVPAEDIGDVGANLNNAGVTDIDDFYLKGSDLETEVGWNIDGDLTEKVWDNMATPSSTVGPLFSPAAANTALTDFINDLFENHGASAGDYLVLRNTYDGGMANYDDYHFYTGSAASDQPVLTLTVPEPSTLALAAVGLLGLRRRKR